MNTTASVSSSTTWSPQPIRVEGRLRLGPDIAAQLLVTAGGNPDRLRTDESFAALCGASPIPASSGKVTRHRLSRGGDRAAICALYRIALVRMVGDQRTKDFVSRQRDAGFSSKEIQRKLKRAIARAIFRCRVTPVAVPSIEDLRPLRRAKNITPTAAANQLGVWPTAISELEEASAATTTSPAPTAPGSTPLDDQ